MLQCQVLIKTCNTEAQIKSMHGDKIKKIETHRHKKQHLHKNHKSLWQKRKATTKDIHSGTWTSVKSTEEGFLLQDGQNVALTE